MTAHRGSEGKAMIRKRMKEIPAGRLLKKLLGFDEIYTVAIRKGGSGALLKDPPGAFSPIRYSRRYWYADPITFRYDGKDYLFAEEFDRNAQRGQIAVAALDADAEALEFQTVLREDYHLSFPMVFAWGDRLCMIPETSENKSLNLYEAVRFPYEWKRIAAFDVGLELVDAVIWDAPDDRTRILLASEVSPENPLYVRYRKLSLHWGENGVSLELLPEGETADFDLDSRNAGSVFRADGKTILPTQRSTSVDYGCYLRFEEIREGRRTELKTLGPQDVQIRGIAGGNRIGIHSYACTGALEVIDLRYLKFAPVQLMKKLGKTLKRSAPKEQP